MVKMHDPLGYVLAALMLMVACLQIARAYLLWN